MSGGHHIPMVHLSDVVMDADVGVVRPGTSDGPHPAPSTSSVPQTSGQINNALPDILNSHVLPPYAGPRQNQRRFRIRNNPSQTSQNRRISRHCSSEPEITQLEDGSKDCCSKESCLACATVSTRFKWVLVGLTVLGILCVLTGIILGALHMSVGSSFLTLSLMFIGLGVMLVIVVGIGWRCTPAGHEPCHLLFGIGSHAGARSSSGNSRTDRGSQDRNQWFGGVLYPEFRYRRPPPTYNASMQDYQQQLVIAQMQPRLETRTDYSLPGSPPPTYRSQASTIRPGLHITFPPPSGDYPNSGPPTYRSRAGDTTERPSLLLDNGSHGQRIIQLAQSEDLTPSSGTASCFSQGTLTDNVAPPSSSRSSTLYRVQQAVQYLDNIIETQRIESRRSRSSRSPSVPQASCMTRSLSGEYLELQNTNSEITTRPKQINPEVLQKQSSSGDLENRPRDIATTSQQTCSHRQPSSLPTRPDLGHSSGDEPSHRSQHITHAHTLPSQNQTATCSGHSTTRDRPRTSSENIQRQKRSSRSADNNHSRSQRNKSGNNSHSLDRPGRLSSSSCGNLPVQDSTDSNS